MRDNLTKRFEKHEENKNVVLACLLDPRYKNHPFSSDDVLAKAKQWLTEDIQQEVQEVPAEKTSAEQHFYNLKEQHAAKTEKCPKR